MTRKKYSIFTEIVKRGNQDGYWIVQAKVIKDAMFYEAHGRGEFVEQAEDIAIERAMKLAFPFMVYNKNKKGGDNNDK